MINILTKSGNLAPYLRATSQSVASPLKPLSPVVPVKQTQIVVQHYPTQQTNYSLRKVLTTRGIRIKSGVSVTTQVRYAHSDIDIPDFTSHRRDSVKCPSTDAKSSDAARKSFSYVIVGVGTVAAAYGAKAVVTQFVMSMSASKDVLAMAQIEINLSDIPEGKSVVFKWRGKPLFIRHRTAAEIEKERNTNVSLLRDPEHDNERVQKPEWLVVIGICTHLGCVPIANAGDWNGYFCPCHGSHYDASGRIRKGPAPSNLEVPKYEYTNENVILVG